MDGSGVGSESHLPWTRSHGICSAYCRNTPQETNVKIKRLAREPRTTSRHLETWSAEEDRVQRYIAPPAVGFFMHDTSLIKTISALKRRENPEYALELLEKMASLVAPIMRDHKMKVGVLTEFYPKNPNLLGLNVNHGMKVCVRLRPAGNDRGFYPLEFCLGTLLHELTHNFYGPHDDKFYKFLAKLEDEYYTLVAKGFTGEGFNSKGHYLGSSGSARLSDSNLNLTAIRVKALEAAQNRKATSTLSINSGVKLGTIDGSPLAGRPKTIKALKALIREAAERRAADAKWCANVMPIDVVEVDSDEDDIIIMNSPLRGESTVFSNSKRSLGESANILENNSIPDSRITKKQKAAAGPCLAQTTVLSAAAPSAEFELTRQNGFSDIQTPDDDFVVVGETVFVDLTSD